MLFPLSLLVVTVLVGILWLTRLEESRRDQRPILKVQEVWSGEERRKEERLPYTVPVLYVTPKSSKFNSSRSRDVSAGGILLVLPEKLATGTRLELEFNLAEEQKPFRVLGEVIWMSEIPPEGDQRLFQTGFRFIWMDKKESERLQRFLYEEKKEG